MVLPPNSNIFRLSSSDSALRKLHKAESEQIGVLWKSARLFRKKMPFGKKK